jgi:hypothetical protein
MILGAMAVSGPGRNRRNKQNGHRHGAKRIFGRTVWTRADAMDRERRQAQGLTGGAVTSDDPRARGDTGGVDPETEARAREIERGARRRRPWPRGLWITAIVVSVTCVIGLAIAWFQDRDTVALKHLDRKDVESGSSLYLGIGIGIAIGIAIGSVMAARRRER